jgi:cytochrome P450
MDGVEMPAPADGAPRPAFRLTGSARRVYEAPSTRRPQEAIMQTAPTTPCGTRSDDAEAVVQELFLTPEGRRDPYPRYHRLRAAAPVHASALGMWLLSRYEDCAAVLRDPRFGKNFPRQMESFVGPDWREHASITGLEESMLNVDGPEHTRQRRLVVKSFNMRTVNALRPSIERTVNRLLDPIADAGGGDILEAVAFPLPVTVIGEMLGVPEPDRGQFRQLVRDVTAIFEMKPTPEQLATADRAQLTMRAYFAQLIAEKRRRPADDLLTRLIQTEDAGDRLTDDELITLGSLLFGAGFETTTSVIGNGLLGLLRHPDQLGLLRADPSLLPNLPDELLRYDGTAQLAARFTTGPAEVGRMTIPAGESVVALLGAGNHDPARYADPDRIDVTRTDVHPLSFGGGIHYCLGAALAKAELEITFGALLGRFATIELAGEPPQFRDRLTLRALNALRIACRPASRVPRRAAAVEVEREVPAAGRPTPPRPAATSPSVSGESGVLGLRPRAGTQGADAGWRDALRAQVEGGAADAGRAPLTGTSLARAAALLARTPLFRPCTADELAELAVTAYPMSFEPGDLLCTEGGVALECYVIAEGEASVTIGGQEVATVGEDDVVGERGPLTGEVRAATVTARTHMITYAISRERLLSLVKKSPAAAEGMFEYMRRRYGR